MLGFLIALSIAGAAPEARQPALDEASSWVGLVDSGRWDESWGATGTLFKSRMPKPGWPSTIAPVRGPLGAVSSRVLKNVTRSSTLPGAPDGEYEVVEFSTSFENKADASETVVLAKEEAGWKVVGYFIR